ncbi:putative transcription factor B3-Domain family [Helianthus debilis subsp. tardiflorus]
MAEEITSNSYEEARKQQLLENKKRFEDLGILTISKTLSDLLKSEKKSKQREVKAKIRNGPVVEPRRSTRERNPIVSYQDDLDIGLPSIRRSKSSSSWSSYLARPLEEVRMASYEARIEAIKAAEKLQSNLQSEYPSFVKSMVRSHVYSCFWLGLPQRFCREHLPKSTVSMVLEDEDGNECEAVFISSRTGLSGGWRAFALEHKLDDGDALLFQLLHPTKFKIYIVKSSYDGIQDHDEKEEADETNRETTSKKRKKSLHSSPENTKKVKKPTAKRSGQPEKAKKSKEIVTATRRSTRITK